VASQNGELGSASGGYERTSTLHPSQTHTRQTVKLFVLAPILFLLFALDLPASQAQNTNSDYAYVNEELSEVISGTVGSGSGDYQVSESRIGKNKIRYERPFYGGNTYYIHSVAAEQASRVKVNIVCNNYRVLDEFRSSNAVGASFEPPHGTQTCTIEAFVSNTPAPDKPHFIGMAIMYSTQNE